MRRINLIVILTLLCGLVIVQNPAFAQSYVSTDIYVTPATNPDFFSGLLGGDGDLSTSEWIDWSIGNGIPFKTFGGNDIVFSTCIGNFGITANWHERMRVTEDGKVGIGTASPGSQLEISNAGDAVIEIAGDSDDDTPAETGNAVLKFTVDGGRNGWQMEHENLPGGEGNLHFKHISNNVVGSAKLSIAKDGNVGIGTASPQGKIHIHDGNGGFLFWTFDGIDGNAQTIIPDGTGDIKDVARFEGVVSASDGTSDTILTTLTPGNNISPTSGLTISVDADGSATIQRTSGSLNYNIALRVTWL